MLMVQVYDMHKHNCHQAYFSGDHGNPLGYARQLLIRLYSGCTDMETAAPSVFNSVHVMTQQYVLTTSNVQQQWLQ